jgi:Nuclease-related domain
VKPVRIQRWSSGQRVRWYVTGPDGQKVGYWEESSGQYVPSGPGMDNLLRLTVNAHLTGRPLPAWPDRVEISPEVHQVNERGTDRDLAKNKPGEAAQQMADEIASEQRWTTLRAKLSGGSGPDAKWRQGAAAERRVGDLLDRLGADWRPLHAVPVGEHGSDLDHLLIGPAGVFAINTKSHRDGTVNMRGKVVQVNGRSVPYVRNSLFEADRAQWTLRRATKWSVQVAPLVVVCDTPHVSVTAPHERVVLLTERELVPWLLRQPSLLSEEQVDRLFQVSRWASTWRQQV